MATFSKKITMGLTLSVLALAGCARKSKTKAHEGSVVTQVEMISEKTSPFQANTEKLKAAAAPQQIAPSLLAKRESLLSPKTFRAATSLTKSIATSVTFAKSEILDREFLYGADVQYSAIKDDDLDLTLQSLAVGHLIAKFQIVGSTLQLLADSSSSFESDINHPDRLLAEYPITNEDVDTVTVRIERASPILVTLLDGAKTPKERSSWVRSVEFVKEGNYLLMETSVEEANGSIIAVMESLFPRTNLVKDKAAPLLADAELEPLAKRYRFLDGGDVFLNVPEQGRVKTKVANRFDLSNQNPLAWYVTPNVPDEYLSEIRTGLEGWNRYSQAMWGRDMIKFAGRLPENIKIGDPRYNVINWDNVADAGAAYESQAADPLTGLQSHSLIYLPLAWVNIGKEYWGRGKLSDGKERIAEKFSRAVAKRTFLGRRLPLNCVEDPSMHLSLRARQDPESFAKELLKNVLFHEVGHSWGLAHNFKGSLSLDDTKPTETFSTSIMDYNQYGIERAAFESVESDKGPLLEYDRQIISVLYNSGKDVKETDAIVPACADEESDDQKGGVDPLCIRYDAGRDPSLRMSQTIRLLSDENFALSGMQSLPKALADSVAELGDPALVVTIDELSEKIEAHANTLYGLVNFYIASGANSLNYMARANVRELYVFKSKALPEGYHELEMRARAFDGLKYVANLETLPLSAQTALDAAVLAVKDWLAKTAAVQALPSDKQELIIAKVMKAMEAVNRQISGGEQSLLSRVRARVLGTVVRVPSSPFEVVQTATDRVDYEALTLGLLENSLTSFAGGKQRPQAERLAAATALNSYRDVESGQAAIDRVESKLRAEIATATSGSARENARALVRELNKVNEPNDAE